MSHDPLCPSYGNPPWFATCQCELIAKVRADERDKYSADWLAANQLHSGEGTE